MNIVYLASVRIPTEKASGLAIVRQCSAFAEMDCNVVLVRPSRNNAIKETLFDYYQVKHCFKEVAVPVLDMVNLFGLVGFLLTRMSMMISSFCYIFFHKKEFDVVYSRDEWLLFLPLLFQIDKKIVWETHTKHSNFVSKFVTKKANLVVPISQALRNFYQIEDQRSLVEPSGVDTDQFGNLPSQNEIRSRLGLPFNKKIVGYIGKYTTMGVEKGVDELITAFAQLKDPEAHLLIVGLEKAESDTVFNLCLHLGLPVQSFTLLPLVQKEFAYYVEASDILVMNYPDTEHYRYYMSPTKLFAFLAAGKIIIASELQSIREIVDRGDLIFVQPNDTNDLRKKLEVALSDFESLKKVYNSGKTKVEKYRWINRAGRILQKMNEIT